MRIELLVYVIGVAVLGGVYASVKSMIDNDLVFVVLCVLYLLAIRFAGVRLGRRRAADE